MSSHTIGQERDKLKHNRDTTSEYPRPGKPLFVSRRALQQQEFFTDSLDSSFIPRPSPPKNATGRAVGARPRRTLGGPRTLKAAFEAVGNEANENRPRSSSSSDQVDSRQPAKPRPTQAQRQPASHTVEAHPKHLTPSPPRGRSAAIISPSSSASSPPRGLAEAYQRILDEEDLAAQEGESIDDPSTDPDLAKHRGADMERDRNRVERIRNSASPLSFKVSRRGSPRPSGRIEEIAAAEEEELKRIDDMGGSEGSTGTSFLENATDDTFGRALLDHTRDQQRVNTVLKNDGSVVC